MKTIEFILAMILMGACDKAPAPIEDTEAMPTSAAHEMVVKDARLMQLIHNMNAEKDVDEIKEMHAEAIFILDNSEHEHILTHFDIYKITKEAYQGLIVDTEFDTADGCLSRESINTESLSLDEVKESLDPEIVKENNEQI